MEKSRSKKAKNTKDFLNLGEKVPLRLLHLGDGFFGRSRYKPRLEIESHRVRALDTNCPEKLGRI